MHFLLLVLQAPSAVQGNHVDSVGVTGGVMLFDSHLDIFIFIYKMVRVGFGLRVERGREIPQVWCVVQKESPEQCGKRFLGTVASELNTIHLILLKMVSHSVVSDSL